MNYDALKYSYPSKRSVVYGRRGMVCTSQPLAAQAGLDIMKAGGNAIDAAIATAACMTVLEPTANGIGGDAFALVWTKGKLHGLNASGKAPMGISAEKINTNINDINVSLLVVSDTGVETISENVYTFNPTTGE